jgi:hypothetical protein
MAYDSTKMRMAARFGIDAGNFWVYNSPDPHATTEGAAYFANGGTIGMKVGDLVAVIEPGGGTTMHSVTVVAAPPNYNPLLPGSNPPGAATISAGQFA